MNSRNFNPFISVSLMISIIILLLASYKQLVAAQTVQATMGGTSTSTGYDPAVCFRAASDNDKTVSYPAKSGPFNLGISNSVLANAWRTQMIQMATAFGNSSEGKALISEMTIVSSGQH